MANWQGNYWEGSMTCQLMNSMGADIADLAFEHDWMDENAALHHDNPNETLIAVGSTLSFTIGVNAVTEDGWKFSFMCAGKWYVSDEPLLGGGAKRCAIYEADYKSGNPVVVNFMPDGWSIDLPVSSNCANNAYDAAQGTPAPTIVYYDSLLPSMAAVTDWITSLYENILSRAPSQAELVGPIENYVNAALMGPSGLNAYRSAEVARMFKGQEYCTNQITALYERLLGRAPNSTEIQPAVETLATGTAVQSFMVSFCSGKEFIGDHPLPTEYTNSVFQLLLKRAPSASEISTTTSDLQAGVPPATVCMQIVRSVEFCNALINDMFQTFLNRAPTSVEVDERLGALIGGAALQDLSAELANCVEYLDNCTTSAESSTASQEP